jgi:hypothetical protein
MSDPPPGDYGMPKWVDDWIAREAKKHALAIETAIIQVGLAGGGKVVVPVHNPGLIVIKVLEGQNESTLPQHRVEYRVPPGSVLRG